MFSAASTRGFTGYKLLKNTPVNRLLVRDPTLSWYNGPVQGQWDNADGLLERLRVVTQRFDPANIIFMGTSMGGYAAILFGCRLNVGKVVAFAPQMILDSRLPNNPHRKHNIQYRDVYPFIAQAKNTSIDILFGSEDLCDAYNLIQAREHESIELINIYGAEHNVMHYLSVHGILPTIIEKYATSGQFDMRLPLCSLHDDMHAMQLTQKSVEAYYFQSTKAAIAPLEILVQFFPQWSAAHFLLGMALARENDIEGAAKSLRNAANRLTQNWKLYLEQAIILTHLGHYKDAESSLLRSIQPSPAPTATHYYRLGIIHSLSGNLSEARKAQENAINLEPNHAAAHYQLGLIFNRLKNHPHAARYFKKASMLGDKNPHLKRHLEAALLRSAEITSPD